MDDFNYTATQGLIHSIQAIYNWADVRSGVKQVVTISHNLLGGVPNVMVRAAVDDQFNILGGYPGKEVMAGSIIFLNLNIILMVAYLFIFIFNLMRGHLFWPHTLLIIYSVSKVVGWALFLCFNLERTKVSYIIAAYSFLIASTIFLIACNLMFSQRIFTWRHIVVNARKLFNNVMYGHYIVVVLLIRMALFCQKQSKRS